MKQVKRFTYILLPVLAIALTSCQGEPFSDADFTAKIFPNGYWDLIIQLGAFVVLLIAVFFIGYKPVKKMIQKRRENVAKMIQDAEDKQRIANEAAAKKEATILEGKEEASHLVEQAKKQAEAERALILRQAEEEASLRRKKADEEIEAAKEKSKQEIREQIVDVAIAASSQVLGREVKEEDNKALLDDFLDHIEGK